MRGDREKRGQRVSTMKNNRPGGRGWSQPSPRAEMVDEVRCLDSAALAKRFAIRHGNPSHIDDEVVVTLFLDARVEGRGGEENTYASELLRRVTRHVKAHVRKN